MGLDGLAAIAEIVGAIAVVVSLAYLGIQVHQNARSLRENSEYLRASNEIASNDNALALRALVLEHPELQDIFRRGSRGDRLEGAEAAKYRLLVQGSFESHLTYFVQHERGLAGDSIWEYWSRWFDDFVTLPGVQGFWKANRHLFPDDFSHYIDKKIPNRR